MVIISGSYPFERSSILLPTNNKEIFMDCGAPRREDKEKYVQEIEKKIIEWVNV